MQMHVDAMNDMTTHACKILDYTQKWIEQAQLQCSGEVPAEKQGI